MSRSMEGWTRKDRPPPMSFIRFDTLPLRLPALCAHTLESDLSKPKAKLGPFPHVSLEPRFFFFVFFVTFLQLSVQTSRVQGSCKKSTQGNVIPEQSGKNKKTEVLNHLQQVRFLFRFMALVLNVDSWMENHRGRPQALTKVNCLHAF